MWFYCGLMIKKGILFLLWGCESGQEGLYCEDFSPWAVKRDEFFNTPCQLGRHRGWELSEVVQARGIDRVIVVTDSTAFSDSAISATVAAVSAVNSYVPSVELVLNSGNSLTISDTSLNTIESAGLRFINDPGLQSIQGSLIAQTFLLIMKFSWVLCF